MFLKKNTATVPTGRNTEQHTPTESHRIALEQRKTKIGNNIWTTH